MTPNSIFALFFRKTCVCFGKSVPQTHDILVFKTLHWTPRSPRIQKKIRAKKRPPCARGSDIYHPSYTFSSTQYRRYNTASALPPGGDPSQHVRVLKATFHHRGTRHFFARALVVGVFVFFVVLMRVVGFQWVWETLLLTWVFCGLLLPKIFCTDKAPFCTYRRMVSVFAKLFPFFSLLLSKVVSDFIQKLHKKKKKSFVENTV